MRKLSGRKDGKPVWSKKEKKATVLNSWKK